MTRLSLSSWADVARPDPSMGGPAGGSGAYVMNGNARYFVSARQVGFAGITLNLVRSTGDQRAEGRL
jgi:hypothetical protein